MVEPVKVILLPKLAGAIMRKFQEDNLLDGSPIIVWGFFRRCRRTKCYSTGKPSRIESSHIAARGEDCTGGDSGQDGLRNGKLGASGKLPLRNYIKEWHRVAAVVLPN